jgi:hypothetical protein
LKAEKWEAKIATHHLAASRDKVLLQAILTLVRKVRSLCSDRVPKNGGRDVLGTSPSNVEDGLGNLNGEIVRGGLIVTTGERFLTRLVIVESSLPQFFS